MNPFFSVIIPLYNKRPHILRSVNSVLNQEFKDFELIVIDDGSTDGGIKELNSLEDEKLKIFSKKNTGVSSARNKGIEIAQGIYIAFLDADDEWDKIHLSNIYELIDKFPDKGVYTSAYKNQNIEGINYKQYIQLDTMYIMNNYFKNFAPSNSSSSVVKKEKFNTNNIRFPENMNIFEDHATFYLIALKYGVAYHIEPTVTIHKDTVNRSPRDSLLLYENFLILHKTINNFIKNNTTTINKDSIIDIKKLLTKRSTVVAKHLIKDKNFKESQDIVCRLHLSSMNCFLFGYLKYFIYIAYKLRGLL